MIERPDAPNLMTCTYCKVSAAGHEAHCPYGPRVASDPQCMTDEERAEWRAWLMASVMVPEWLFDLKKGEQK